MAKSSPRKRPTKSPKLGALPEWNLDDLYPGLDSPELKWDLENAETRCGAFGLERPASRFGILQVPFELGAVEAGIEVVEVPLRQRAELGRLRRLFPG